MNQMYLRFLAGQLSVLTVRDFRYRPHRNLPEQVSTFVLALNECGDGVIVTEHQKSQPSVTWPELPFSVLFMPSYPADIEQQMSLQPIWAKLRLCFWKELPTAQAHWHETRAKSLLPFVGEHMLFSNMQQGSLRLRGGSESAILYRSVFRQSRAITLYAASSGHLLRHLLGSVSGCESVTIRLLDDSWSHCYDLGEQYAQRFLFDYLVHVSRRLKSTPPVVAAE